MADCRSVQCPGRSNLEGIDTAERRKTAQAKGEKHNKI